MFVTNPYPLGVKRVTINQPKMASPGNIRGGGSRSRGWRTAGRMLLCLAVPALLASPLMSPKSAASPRHTSSVSHRRSRSSRHSRPATATFYRRGESSPHLANGDYYANDGPWFCAVDESRRGLLNHRIRVINTHNGRSHVFLVSDLGRFARGNIDISRGGSSRMMGRGGPDSFPVEWHDLGPAPGNRRYHKRQHDKHRS